MKYLVFLAVGILSFSLAGCGASKPPLPSGSRIAVTQWAAQIQQNEAPPQKKEVLPTARTIPLEPDYLSTFEAPNEGDWP